MRRLAFLFVAIAFFTSNAWGAAHWVDVTTAVTSGADGTARYMRWSPLVADATGNVSKLRINIKEYGSPTEIRLALFTQAGVKQTEGTATVTAAGYKEIAVPPVTVTQGATYYLAAQAASDTLNRFGCGAASGGMEGPNTYSAGFPQRLPESWGAPLLTGGMYIEGGPVADFTGTPTTGTAPLTVQFSDKSSGSITGWLWNFGDSSQATEQNPQHIFAAPGLYPVSLTVSGPDGSDTALKADYVRVVEQIPPGNNEYQIKVDPAAHQKFGLYYPVTYRFRIPPGASNLSAQYRYQETTWNTLPVKTTTDIFNGIDAVRFDYAQAYAYISVRFSRTSDNIFLRILDAASQPVSIQFDRIPKYYDNRKAAVTISLDDWDLDADASFRLAADQLNSLGLYYSMGLRLLDPPWSSIQEKINQSGDKMEISAHSIYHSCDAKTYQLHGYDTEVSGCRDLIRDNLTFAAHPYVPLFIDPCGYWDSALYSAVTTGDFLIERSVDEIWTDFVAWDANAGRYGRAGVTYDWWGNDSQSSMTTANNLFDSTIAAGGIYHLMDHPWLTGHFKTGSYTMQHLNYIKGRADLWYAPFGSVYLYRYLQEMRGNLVIQPVSGSSTAPVASFTATPVTGTSPLSVTFTDGSTGTITAWSWDFGDSTTSTQQNPVHVYNDAGTYTVKLTVTGPGGSNSMTSTGYIKVQSGSSTPVVASFSATPLTGVAPLSVSFTDSSTGPITGWSWDFGDSATSSDQNPVHLYSTASTYSVKLTVAGPDGSNSVTKTDYIQAQPAPVGHWVDVTTAKTGAGMNGTAKYMSWGPVVADNSGQVTKLRISVRDFGNPTQIRLGLYSPAGVKLTEGVATVTAAGYAVIAVPAAAVVQGSRYFIAAQAASASLHKFDTGAGTGGFEGANKYSIGLPTRLPSSWSNVLLTSGMYIE